MGDDLDGSAVPPLRRGGRNRTVAVRLTPAEWEAWREAATLAGRPQLGAWVRAVMTGALEGRRLPDVGSIDQLEALAGELGREGSNLNQAVRSLNALAVAGSVDEGQMQAVLSNVEHAARAVTLTQRKLWAAADRVG